MPNITPTTRQQITSAQQQLSLIRNELDQLVMRGKISRELYSFLDKLLSAEQSFKHRERQSADRS